MPTTTDIKIAGHLTVDTLLEFKITQCLNQHSYLSYTGIVNEENAGKIMNSLAKKENISVSIAGEIVFNGILLSVYLHCENDAHTLSVSCVSHSFLLDAHKTSHSFQDIGMTHKDVIKRLFDDSNLGDVVVRDVIDKKIDQPIIKYHETDWQFTRRMAAHINSVIYPHTIGETPQVFVGTKETSNEISISTDYFEGYNTAFYLQQKQYRKNISLEDYFYIKFKISLFLNIGEQLTVNVKGKTHRLFVCEKQIKLVGDVVVITYTTGSICPYIYKFREDEKLTGLTLSGTVLDPKGELIKVHLDIDGEQEQEKAFWFDYKPAVGNVFHVMPQIGTTALLQLNRNYGGSGLVTHVIHKNADNVSEMADYNRRYFTTEFGKRLAMLPELLDFKNKEKNHHLELADAKGVTATTTSEFKIMAEENITMHAGKNLTAHSPEKIYITKVGTKGGIEMSGGDIHIKSKCSKLVSRSRRPINKYRSKPKLPAMKISKSLALKAIAMTPNRISVTGKK